MSEMDRNIALMAVNKLYHTAMYDESYNIIAHPRENSFEIVLLDGSWAKFQVVSTGKGA